MVINIRKKRELVARILGVGVNRVRFEPDKLEDVADSITRENLRALIKNGAIWTARRRGTSRYRAKLNQMTRKKRGTGKGSKKGKKTARVGKKRHYITKIRAMRHYLKVLKERNDIDRETYWSLYKKANGGQVRNLAHLRDLVKVTKSR
jgi:large subunit ribosomal protein L19e